MRNRRRTTDDGRRLLDSRFRIPHDLGRSEVRTWKRLARYLTFKPAETAWVLFLRLAGTLLRPKPDSISFTGDERVLVIAPHPDDETLGCGGTLALQVRAGDRVRVLVVTDGGGSRAQGLTREEMVRVRSEEAAAAMQELGQVELVRLALPEGGWSQDDLVNKLCQTLQDYGPTVIYAPSCVDYHPEHLRVATALAAALKGKGVVCRTLSEAKCVVRIYEVQVPLTWVLANRISPGPDIAIVRAALAYLGELDRRFGVLECGAGKEVHLQA